MGNFGKIDFWPKIHIFDPLKFWKFYTTPPHTFYRFNFFGTKLTKVFHRKMGGIIFFISPYLFFSRRRGHLNFEIFAKNGPKIDFLGHPTPKLVARSILTANSDSPSNFSSSRAFWKKNNFFFDKNFLLKDLIYCSSVSIGNFQNFKKWPKSPIWAFLRI